MQGGRAQESPAQVIVWLGHWHWALAAASMSDSSSVPLWISRKLWGWRCQCLWAGLNMTYTFVLAWLSEFSFGDPWPGTFNMNGTLAFFGDFSGNESACQCRRHRFDPWFEKIPWRRNGNPLQYSCLGNPMDRGAWWATVRGVPKSRTWLGSWARTHLLLPTQAGGLRSCSVIWIFLFYVSL